MTFCLESDHKPLVALFGSKLIDDGTSIPQRVRAHLVRHTYEIINVPGKKLTAALALSRSLLNQSEANELETAIARYLGQLFSRLPVSIYLRCKN